MGLTTATCESLNLITNSKTGNKKHHTENSVLKITKTQESYLCNNIQDANKIM